LIVSRIHGKRTKIVATLGPSSNEETVLRQMVRAGIDVARINFSHNSHEVNGKMIDDVRRIAEEEGVVVAVLADIQGPKIRVGKITKPLNLLAGDTVTLTLDQADGENGIVQLPHPEFLQDIKVGTRLLLDDGKLEFEVKSLIPRGLVCIAVIPGILSSNKGVMAPNARLTLSAITDKDSEDIRYALSKDVDYVAMSFVRSPKDVQEMRFLIRHLGGKAAIISKIEKHEALEEIEAIIAESDGIMVARGDLGLEIPAEEVPYHQKKIIKLCNDVGKPVITATQMLNSMEKSPRPTRAEASDVYNAILDGTDAVMLSNESASGDYPVKSVEMMVNIASIAERNLFPAGAKEHPVKIGTGLEGREAISDAISQATSQVADALNCKAIITTTLSGYTTRRVARERPKTPIICVTPNPLTYKQVALVWGTHPILLKHDFKTVDEMLRIVIRAAFDAKLVDVNDSVVVIAGVPFGVTTQTNFLKLHIVGEANELQ
jgi:pyruvate kinase